MIFDSLSFGENGQISFLEYKTISRDCFMSEMENFISKLKKALCQCVEMKEKSIIDQDFEQAARYRDYGNVIKKIISECESEIINEQTL